MSPPNPASLGENAGLAFVGETLWEPARLTSREAKSFAVALNPTGRPNSDVIRRFISVKSRRAKDHFQIDFPAHFHEQEAGLYLKPASHLRSRSNGTAAPWWLNPHANASLRTAVARLDRYLATPLEAETPAWDWIDSECLPAAGLLVITRDDDFAHGILQSRFFRLWWHAWTAQISPREIVESFPFPWPPVTLLSALTRAQEEHRLGIARAARSGNQDQVDTAVAMSYKGPSEMTDQETVAFLKRLNHQRATDRATK